MFDGLRYGVTARHVVQPPSKPWGTWSTNFTQPLFIRAKPANTNFPPADLHRPINMDYFEYDQLYSFSENPQIDIAVFPAFSFKGAPEEAYCIPFEWIQDDTNVIVGEDVNIFGFPGPYGFDKGEAVIRSGTICYKLSPEVYLLDANLWPGDSGALVASKPYFGVPDKDHSRYQWHFGGKILGVESMYVQPSQFLPDAPKELQGFRVIFSGEAIKELFESKQFKEKHELWKRLMAQTH
jgi:hypothetical protein